MRQPFVFLALYGVAACAHAASTPAPLPPKPYVAAFAMSELIEPVAPIALDGNDGTRLTLEKLAVTVTVHGPLSLTVLHATFANPSKNTIEGRFRLALPPRSSVAGLSMKIGNEWREAAVAETSAARDVYEAIMHRRRDPLLVEQRREREIAARVAPIFALEQKEIIVTYTSEIGPDLPIVVPLRGLPEVGTLDVSIVDGATEPFQHHGRYEKPLCDDIFRAVDFPSTFRSGNFVALRMPIEVEPVPDPIDQRTVVLVDTSASADIDAAIDIVRDLPNPTIIAYDQTAAVVSIDELRARGALGAADLGVALVEAKSLGAKRVIIIGGAGNLSEPKKLLAARQALIDGGVERIDALGTNALNDARQLRPLALRGVTIEDAPNHRRAMLAYRLAHRVADVPVKIPGATWTSAQRFEAASPGEERIVYAQIPVNGPTLEDPAVAHGVAAAQLETLVARGEQLGWTDAAKSEVIGLAKKHHLSSPFTSLIVLENDRDVALLRNVEGGAPVSAPLPPPPPRPGTSTGSHRVTRAPMMRMASTEVNGRLPPEVIQRTIRLHYGKFRGCYADGLRRNPQLKGRVVVRFVIARDGSVTRAQDGGSDLPDQGVVACMVHAVESLGMPPPEGGVVTVTYPFMLDPEAAEPAPQALGVMARPRFRHEWPAQEPPAPWSNDYILMKAHPETAPRTPFGFVALGEALESLGHTDRAARAYASLAELWPERTELVRAAAMRLDHLNPGSPLAVTLLRRAVADRPDQPSSHHLLGLTLLRAGDREGARAAFQAGLDHHRYELRYGSVDDLLKSDLALLEPAAERPLRRVSLAWETDTSSLGISTVGVRAATIGFANDGFGPTLVDFGEDVTTPLTVQLHRRGMGGDVLGTAHVIKRNERGDVTVEPRPFAIMNEGSSLDLGSL